LRFSILTVHYSEPIFNGNTRRSLDEQNFRDFEFIPIDNAAGNYRSAAEAYNERAKTARGDYLVFMHQDLKLMSPEWLGKLAEMTGKYRFDIAGCSGINEAGEELGFIRDRRGFWGHPAAGPHPAQTLDEIVLVISKKEFLAQGGFDIALGWHSYGADLCLRMLKADKKVVVLPLFLWHNSPSLLAGVESILWKLRAKHGAGIYTTSGSTGPRHLLIGSFKAILPKGIRNRITYLMTALGMSCETNTLSYRFRKCKSVLVIEYLSGGSGPYLVPPEISYEGFNNNPIWEKKSVKTLIVSDKRGLTRGGIEGMGKGYDAVLLARSAFEAAPELQKGLSPVTKDYFFFRSVK